jgi:hypothetical protein
MHYRDLILKELTDPMAGILAPAAASASESIPTTPSAIAFAMPSVSPLTTTSALGEHADVVLDEKG